MNVTLTSLEALILKATHESLPCPDAAALEAFCTITRDSAEGPQLAAQALANRIHSLNAREALLALVMIDRCMRRCDANFHAEVGKFRFLNEMIKLVSPKYFADRTAPEVRTRVLQLLHAWSIEYPKESKFKVAYDMLKNQGVVKETPPPLPPEDSPAPPPRHRAKSAIFEDEERSKLLQKLLQSKKQEDLQHANRLIKTMVREEERRSEANSRRAHEVGAALDSAGLLNDMLSNAANASPDEEQLICELNSTCARLKPVLQHLAATESDENLSDILYASDVLDEVCARYKAFAIERKKRGRVYPNAPKPATNTESLLDFAGANVNNEEEKETKQVNPKKNALDELGDIFSAGADANIVEPLKPVNAMPNDDADLLGDKTNKVEGWVELDSLGEQLMKQSLPEHAKRIDNFNSKTAKKIPMNALASPKHEAQSHNNGALLDLDFFTRKAEEDTSPVPVPQTSKTPPLDDIIVDITEGPAHSNSNEFNNNVTENNLNNILDLEVSNAKSEVTMPVENKDPEVTETKVEVKANKTKDVKPLNDINVSLHSVQPSKVPPLTAFEEEDGVTVVLHFCKDKPRPDVNVIVISTTSKNKSPIEDYKFQSVLPKGCKVRLLTPSGTSLPAYNPFLPPPALTQVMLIARPPTHTAINLKFVITYTCDEEMCSEMGEVKELPLDDI
ncbi:ADP-ribosylation factor-binding protein GGA3 [Manduca sexta]|uniref:ADP-ribosylation factor-binding protein GGA1 n=1 Tax=Manduca sexta TaxID=7130 RepID=A0A921YS12_MANSE|nr:ADP-ribosylation factor-binding protein GGA3 [Manduca sexta]KAG6444506.1 hypothetical protein O3G_MSEX003448 [Manduca sexta]